MTDISDRIEEKHMFDTKTASIDEDPITSAMNPMSYLIRGESILHFLKRPVNFIIKQFLV